MKKISLSQITTILVTILVIVVNVLANVLPINGQGTGEISDRFEIYFVPAGYVFSIWGLIYIGLIAFTIYQALPSQRENELLKKIYPGYWIGNLANVAWIFLWHYERFPLTLIAMLTLLISLIYIYQKIAEKRGDLERNQKWFVKYPISIYLGWISVATIANISQVLFYRDWGGWGISPSIWAVIMIATATILGLIMRWRENDILFGLVLVWAFVGINVSQSETAIVAITALVGVALLVLSWAIFPFLKKGLA